MRLRQLESFIAVCELRSISRAAERLHVAQPALGLQIRGLEEEMGAQLLERHARGVQPTAAGERVLQWARLTLADLQQLKEELRLMSTGLAGTVTLGLTPSIATAFALPILTELQREMPGLNLRLSEALGSVLRDWVKEGRLEFALVFDQSAQAEESAQTAQIPQTVLTERLYFITTPKGPGAGDGPIALAEVIECPLAMPAKGDALRTTVETAARAMDLPVRIEYEVQSTGVMLSMVRSGLACTVMPLAMAVEGLREGKLAARRIASPELLRHLRWYQGPAGGGALHHALRRVVQRVLREAASDPMLGEAYTFVDVEEGPRG